MKYFVTKFTIGAQGGNAAPDEPTMATARELCAALAGYAGYESFEDTKEGVDGYVQQDCYDEQALRDALGEFPMEGLEVAFRTEAAEDKNWNEQWEKEGFEPICIGGRCRIHDIYHKTDPQPYPIDIEIDARQAFGTGTHDTTRMIVGRLLAMELGGKSVVDCGCGTGILSIVASKCGASRVVAYDIDEWSADNTRHNAAINGVGNITALLGDVGALRSVEGEFDVALANINRNILLADMPEICAKLRKGGTLIISGFYADDAQMLTEKARELGMRLTGRDESDNWTMLAFEKM